MKKLKFEVYLLELNRQAAFALYSVEEMENALNDEIIADLPTFWFYAQSFLSSCANISKLLWKSSRSYEQDGINNLKKKLRELLEINDNSPLKKREVRNCFEHYDERLFEWLSNHDIYADSCVGSRDIFNPNEHLRLFDTDTMTLCFQGKEFCVKDTIPFLFDIKDKTNRLINGNEIFE